MADKEAKSPRKTKKEKKEKKKRDREEPKGEQEDEMFDLEPTGEVHKVSVQLKDCPVQHVTVYNDRAEVTRALSTSINAGLFGVFWETFLLIDKYSTPGTNELTIVGLPSHVDSNSVRVSGGKGAAVILEVLY